ncbi:hypothetical protein GCM10023116_15480 [Kistimonas scapharcae]|uniref:Uncharacterized protein n=1 Tax=Kistimonas scapharcae TaxID=1036133 RepID=A0ABP8V1I0_9GAMM
MTIKELIQHLSKHPDDLHVMVRAYEQGFDIVSQLERATLFKNPTDHEYEGNFIYQDDRKILKSRRLFGQDVYPMQENEEILDTLILHGDSR